MEKETLEEKVLETIKIAKEAVGELFSLANKQTIMQFLHVSRDLGRMLTGIQNILRSELRFKKSLVYLNNALSSLKNLQWLVKDESSARFMRIEFELLPLLEELYYEFYITTKVIGDTEREYHFFFEECPEFGGNKYINESLKTNIYPYEVSISVMAYNHLDCTKQCVESILKYMPRDLNYELILVNHGSKDGTREYFNAIAPTKQLDLAENLPGTNIAAKVIQGKYWCYISNDVIVTKNYLINMLKCMRSDEKIVEIVPTTPNISNLQSIQATYNTMEEMFAWAEKNNISNPYRWEQRARLCNPMGLIKSEYVSSKGEFYKVKLLNERMAYPDDAIAALHRRSGKKMILAKDTYCYHHGSVTIGSGKKTIADYSGGKQIFERLFSIDPWGKGFCHDPILFSKFPFDEKGDLFILGINCGIGSNPLKMKEALKENGRNDNVIIYNATAEKNYLKDLQGLSDEAIYCKNFLNPESFFCEVKFTYIIVEGFEGISNAFIFQRKLMQRLKSGGKLFFLDFAQNADQVISSGLYQGKIWGYYSKK